MVLSLQRLAGCEDRNALAGHVLVLLDRDYDLAQQLFLQSATPKAALEVRRHSVVPSRTACFLMSPVDDDALGAAGPQKRVQ